MNSMTTPSAFRIANDSGSGVCGTSPPRILRSQAINSGMVSTAAAAPSPASALPMRARLSAALSPANSSGWAKTGASGTAGRPGQTESSGFLSTGFNVAPARSTAALSRSTSCGVCSHGS